MLVCSNLNKRFPLSRKSLTNLLLLVLPVVVLSLAVSIVPWFDPKSRYNRQLVPASTSSGNRSTTGSGYLVRRKRTGQIGSKRARSDTDSEYMTPSIIQCDGIIRNFGHTRTDIKARGMLCQSAGIHLVIELIFWYLASLNLHQVEIFGTRCGLRTADMPKSQLQ